MATPQPGDAPVMTVATPVPGEPPLLGWRLSLELTARCQIECVHCFASSGPTGGHGSMTGEDWHTVITDAAEAGVSSVQLIGGEPTIHPQFGQLLRHAIDAGLSVEVYTNLLRVRDEWWGLLESPQVTLATSYYSSDPAAHDRVTGRTGSHARTRANIAEAIRRGIPVRAGIVDLGDGQSVEQARAELMAMGVRQVGIDRVRGVGRGTQTLPDVSELCGNCGRGQAAISPDGDVWPCVLGRWLTAGTLKTQSLAEILRGQKWRDLVAAIPGPRMECNPEKNTCEPTKRDGSDCPPSEKQTCDPSFCNPDRGGGDRKGKGDGKK